LVQFNQVLESLTCPIVNPLHSDPPLLWNKPTMPVKLVE
jgi:hypothetical protein